jgi:hypothetical protein
MNSTEGGFAVGNISHPELRFHPASESESGGVPVPGPIWRIGGRIIGTVRQDRSRSTSKQGSGPSTRAKGSRDTSRDGPRRLATDGVTENGLPLQPMNPLAASRAIRFPDEELGSGRDGPESGIGEKSGSDDISALPGRKS